MLYKFRDTTPINTDPVTVTGEMVTVDASDEITDLVGVTASLEPIQDLHGYDKPWAGGAGKNLLHNEGENVTHNGITYTVNADGSVTANGTSTGNAQIILKRGFNLKAGTYTISGCPSSLSNVGNNYIRLYSSSTDFTISDYPTTKTDATKALTQDITDGTMWINIAPNTTVNDVTFYPQLELGSTATSYEPYSNICPISGHTECVTYVSPTTSETDAETYTTTLGRTVYGGTLDVVSGVLTVTHRMDDMGSLNWASYGTGLFYANLTGAKVANYTTPANAYCSCYEILPMAQTPTKTGVAINNGQSRANAHDESYASASDFKTAVNGQTLVYELSTPQTYQLTPQEVELLLGTNNLWTDCGEISVTTKKTLDRVWLPSEAVSINGQYLENVVDGYRTLYTKGRESLEVELDTYSVGTADGETYKSKRYPARTIKVGFQLIAPDNYEFRRRFNQLNNLLSLDEADFIFNDETDKFFAGIPRFNCEVDAGENSVKGEWEIYCAYPFKRTVEPVTLTMSDAEVTNTSATFTINYKGGQPAYPVLKATFAGAKSGGSSSEDGDCGFVAFLDEDENIIQLGNPDVIDRDQYASAVTLINKEFVNTTGWTGSATIRNITDTYWQRGKGQTQSYASMGNLSQTTEGAVDLKIGLVHRLCINNAGQTGTFGVSAKDANGNIVCGFVIRKTGNGTTARVEYILGGAVRGADNIDVSYYNTHFGYCNRTPVYVKETYTVPTTQTTKVMVKVGKKKKKKKYKTITKTVWVKKVRTVQKGWNFTQSNLNSMFVKDADKVTFNIGNLPARTFKLSDIAQTVSTTIQIYGTGNFHTNAVHSAIFRRETGAVFAEQPNVFTAGDVVEADCNDATVQLYRDGSIGGSLEPQYGALGNDWESFKLHNGYNVIRAVWSDWVNPTYKPSIEIEYNEVFI